MKYEYEVLQISEFPIPIFNVETYWSCGSERFLLFDDYCRIGRYEYTRSGKGRFIESFSGKILNPTNFAILPPCPIKITTN